jgi:hypothetical protein
MLPRQRASLNLGFAPLTASRLTIREHNVARIAFMTFGVLYEPRTHSRSKGFINRIPATYEVAERSEGFIDRSHLDPDTGRHSWGELVCPRFLPDELHPNVARTLTLWRSLESVFAFSYADLHGEALTLRAQWFRKPEFPSYVIWWVADDHVRWSDYTPMVLTRTLSISGVPSIRTVIPRSWTGYVRKRSLPEMPKPGRRGWPADRRRVGAACG